MLLDVPLGSLSVETVGGMARVLVLRDMPILIKKTEVLFTATDSQSSVVAVVLRSARRYVGDGEILGNLEWCVTCRRSR